LRKKLLKPEHQQLINKVEEIKDLAGCRIIFYFNDDVDKFINFLDTQKVFHILDKKYHYPDNITLDNPYTAIHLVVSLDSSLFPEFTELKCEIQICTILDHAWSETVHDIIYKPRYFSRGDNVYNYLESLSQKIMKDYIKPAGFEFQKLKNLEDKIKKYKSCLNSEVNDHLNLVSSL
jgi:ppGpp synthetase/RelA/SpoT-type nucleotidyltranferase